MMTITSQNLSQALAAGGELTTVYENVWHALWDQPYVPVAALELCRLRLAQMHGAAADSALRVVGGISEEKIHAVLAGRYVGREDFADAELAMLDLTEVYAQDPAAITDAMADRVKRHVGEAGLVCLVEALGFFDGRIRLGLMFSALQPTVAVKE